MRVSKKCAVGKHEAIQGGTSDMNSEFAKIRWGSSIGILMCVLFSSGFCQTTSFSDTAAAYFEEVKVATTQNMDLWNIDLYAPLLLVDRVSRMAYANDSDTAGLLEKHGAIFQGSLPKTINISNTSLVWNGKRWAMAMLPLPLKKEERINFLAHELFHRAQALLGFEAYNPTNDHLDKKEGRVYLRLELEALKKALSAQEWSEIKQHLTNALLVRKLRHTLFPGADSTENLLELNEGLTEYTGAMISGRNRTQMIEHFVASIDGFMKDPSYIRSFAYQTIPVYGYLLSRSDYGWNKGISKSTNLSDFLMGVFGIRFPDDLKGRTAAIKGNYNGDAIEREEVSRETRIAQQIHHYKQIFLEEPHFDIFLERMNMSFEYQNISSLEDKGVVYPVIRITDVWGILDVKNGALISPEWNKATISAPTVLQEKILRGDGWELELDENYFVQKDDITGNYFLKKK